MFTDVGINERYSFFMVVAIKRCASLLLSNVWGHLPFLMIELVFEISGSPHTMPLKENNSNLEFVKTKFFHH